MASKDPKRISRFVQLGLLLLVPVAGWLLASDAAEISLPAEYCDAEVQNVLDQPSLSDIQRLTRLEPAMQALQSTRVQQEAEMDRMLPELFLRTASPLFWWDRVERTARRHKSTLDYFLGFGY